MELNSLTGKDKSMKLSALLRGAGFSGADIPIGIGVINAESGGNPNSVNANDGGPGYPSVGLGQINTKAHLAALRSASGKTTLPEIIKWLKNPVNNVKFMKTVHGGSNGWNNWTMYTNGKYRLYTRRDKDVKTEDFSFGEAITDIPGDAAGAVTGGIESVGKFFSILTSADTWFRVLKGSGGAMFIVLGTGTLIFAFAKSAFNSDTGRVATKVVAKATPVGKAVKAAT